MRWLGVLALACLSAEIERARAQAPEARQVAAPASDILSGVVRLPDPSSVPTISRAALLPLRFERTPSTGWTAEVLLPLERGGAVALALLSPDAGTWRVEVGAAGAPLRPIAEALTFERHVQPAGDVLAGWVVDRYDIAGAPSGMWTVRVEADDPGGNHPPEKGWLILKPDGDLSVETYVTTQHLVGDEVIGVVARARGPLAGPRVETARMQLESAGRSQSIAMLDDGQHADGALGDGLFGALVPASVRGETRVHVELSGTTRGGGVFLRTAELAFPVLEREIVLDGTAAAIAIDELHVGLEIGALPLGTAQRFHVSAEVWGHDARGAWVPVCWLSRQSEIGQHTGTTFLPLTLDRRWLAETGAHAPFELRAVRAQDPDSEVVFDLVDRMRIEIPVPPNSGTGPQPITSEMLTGGTSLSLSSTSPLGPHTHISPTYINPALMLVHGYCSGGSIWPAADFTQPKLEFLDPNANRPHDQFAQLIIGASGAAHLSSFGVVTHSQGGCAALHLLTYYVSGLDLASGARRIQALAAPFQGTPLASLGGFACGVNDDMTLAGAATWLAGIPTWARAEVYYWTTSNTGSACNFLTNLFLTDPEDGTVEQIHGQLPGGNNMGHTTGWCHTTGMSNPASYTDHTRNQAMNAAAAR
jgi:hypothetical protein